MLTKTNEVCLETGTYSTTKQSVRSNFSRTKLGGHKVEKQAQKYKTHFRIQNMDIPNIDITKSQ